MYQHSWVLKFWGRVQTGHVDACWPWIGAKFTKGYGAIGHQGRVLIASRVSWELAHNLAVPAGMVIMHSCDNPGCVNPGHLRLGSQRQNVADMVAKGRAPRGRSTGPRVRWVERALVLRACGTSQTDIAHALGMSLSAVYRALKSHSQAEERKRVRSTGKHSARGWADLKHLKRLADR